MEWKTDIFAKRSKPIDNALLEVVEAYPFDGNESILLLGMPAMPIIQTIASKIPDGFLIIVDPHHALIENAKQKASLLANTHFSHSDIATFSFAERFHVIFSFDLPHYTPHIEKIIPKLLDHLLPAGKVILRFSLKSAFATAKNLVEEKYVPKVLSALPYPSRERDEIEMAFMKHPFTDLYFRDFSFAKKFANEQALRSYYQSWAESIENYPTKMLPTLVKEMVEKTYDDRPPKGPISIDFPYLHIECIR